MLANSAVGGVAHHTKKLISDSLMQPVAVLHEALWAPLMLKFQKNCLNGHFERL